MPGALEDPAEVCESKDFVWLRPEEVRGARPRPPWDFWQLSPQVCVETALCVYARLRDRRHRPLSGAPSRVPKVRSARRFATAARRGRGVVLLPEVQREDSGARNPVRPRGKDGRGIGGISPPPEVSRDLAAAGGQQRHGADDRQQRQDRHLLGQ